MAGARRVSGGGGAYRRFSPPPPTRLALRGPDASHMADVMHKQKPQFLGTWGCCGLFVARRRESADRPRAKAVVELQGTRRGS